MNVIEMLRARYLREGFFRHGWINLILTVLLMASFNILGELFGCLLPRNPNLYLDNIVLAKKS